MKILYFTAILFLTILITGCAPEHATVGPARQDNNLGYVVSGGYYPYINSYSEHGGLFVRQHVK